ncbi:exonuclease [Lapidilactobacillus concavus DSM 17758]|uniref:Nuclease SbcCD subunit C n=1 Tax=Lapidilactobacillus concavus DSM 17758 TaxID=1423735 RepID=A0A0R1W7J4_9LACO|nr:SMC family ATPase [Lapidilactobacillus concavus]KRM13872.1 exonuclease [Lapidilactobacillus concavus DSM 17758]GEL13169.1 nuclease SbcCD subunit C [Lapidilactobacillus concavus]
MRPLKLTMNFFGPYRHEAVDFTAFDQSPMFLISGPTGAGKSTIFDGLVYALYGTASGSQREVGDFRSEFASDDDETSVELTFIHRNRFYRIKRQPEQILAKKRGSGTTKRAAQVELTVYEDETDATEVKQYTKIDATNIFLADLLQLNADQFRQIVLLPQGEFRMFLNGDSNQKEAVLRNLFQTKRYERWVVQIQEHFKRARQQNIAAQQKIQMLLQQVETTENSESSPAKELEVASTTDKLARLKIQTETLSTTLDNVEVVLSKLTEENEQKQNQLAELRRIQELFEQRTSLEIEAESLQVQATKINQIKQQLQLATWAEKNRSQVLELRQLLSLIETTQRQILQAQQEDTQISERLSQAETQKNKLDEQASEQEKLAQKVFQLTALQPLYREITEINTHKKTITQQYNQQKQRLAELKDALEQNQQQRQKNKAAQQKQPDFYTQQLELEHRQQSLTNWQQTLTQLQSQQESIQQLTQKISQLEQASMDQQEVYEQSLAVYQEKKSDYAYQQILVLRRDLLPGQPCPVCGSKDHPQAEVHDVATAVATISEQMVEDADQKRQDALKQLTQSKNQLMMLHEQLDKLIEDHSTAERLFRQNLRDSAQTRQSSLDQQATLTDINSWLTVQQTTITTQQSSLRDQQVLAEQRVKQLEQLEQQQVELVAQQTVEQTNEAKLEQELLVIETQVADKQKQLPTEFKTLIELNQFLQVSQKQLDQYRQSVEANRQELNQLHQQQTANQTNQQHFAEQLKTQRERYNDSRQQLATIFDKVWPDMGFDEQLVRFAEVANTINQMAEWQTQLTTFEQQVLQNKALIRNLNAQLANYHQVPDLDAAQQEVQTVKRQLTHQQEIRAQLKSQIEQQEKIYQQVDDLNRHLTDLSELQLLSEVTRGNGSQKLGLERYVLRTFLREVLEVANQRLARLTEGRYQLTLATESGATRKNSGLELDVFDDYVGHHRSVRTLSGGESFITALALALALGEVVQQQTGAVEINALFVDEGFGSLDENSLHEAIDALMSLESQQRMIGIISHVRELQTQIPDQLKVTSTGGGESQIRYQLSAEA